jgi:starvation-inducible DNA-binding protein
VNLADELKVLLADTVALYLRSHGYHWNVEGNDFREYHLMFEEIYSDVYESIDPIAENIRKIKEYAPYRMERLVDLKTLPEETVSTDPKSMATDLLSAIEHYIDSLNSVLKTATNEDEQGIVNFIAGRIETMQKWAWFLRASLA